jgi:hypothetical protein
METPMTNKNLLDFSGKVYDANKSHHVARQLQMAELDGWSYVAETKDGFGRVAIYDDAGEFVAYY